MDWKTLQTRKAWDMQTNTVLLRMLSVQYGHWSVTADLPLDHLNVSVAAGNISSMGCCQAQRCWYLSSLITTWFLIHLKLPESDLWLSHGWCEFLKAFQEITRFVQKLWYFTIMPTSQGLTTVPISLNHREYFHTPKLKHLWRNRE